MLTYVLPHRFALLGGGLLGLVTTGAGLTLPLVVRELIAELALGRSVTLLLLLLTVGMVVNAGVGALGHFVLQRSAESVVLSARQTLISRLLRLRLSTVERNEPGDLMSRVTVDTTLLREVATDTLVGGTIGLLTLAATVVLMALLDGVLLASTLAAVAFTWAVTGPIVSRITLAARRAQDSVGVMGAALERMFGALRTVKASGAEPREGDRVRGAATAAWQASVRAAGWSAVAGNLAGLANQVAFIAVLGVGGARVASGAIDVGTLVAFLLYIYALTPAVQQLIRAVTRYRVGLAAVSRIQEAEAMAVEDLDDAGADPVVRGRPPRAGAQPATVVFEDVWFRYGPELPAVHRGVSFTVPAGGVTAFVGPSGSGKTTVFSLIERFWEPESGRVLVDGSDVTDWPLVALRAAIGYVEQDAPVLSGTLRENLLYGAPHATQDELHAAVTTARLDALVANLPKGLDNEVGHRGMTLSGGERQRVAIARALLRRPSLLLLDEATSQLDAVNEAALRETVNEAARVATVLVVAHRLSTVTTADRIVLLDGGAVRAVGSHAELVASEPLYAELAATQLLATAA
jgi:ATP-binding cassette subfamily C protein